MDSILKSYGIPHELTNEINLWTHKIKFNATLQEIKSHKGLTTKNKIAVRPRVVDTLYYSLVPEDPTESRALSESNVLYSLLTEKWIVYDISWYVSWCFNKPGKCNIRCAGDIPCYAMFHDADCTMTEWY